MYDIEKHYNQSSNNVTKVIRYFGVNENRKVEIDRWRFEAGKYNSTSQPMIMRSEFVILTNSTDTKWSVFISDQEPEMFNCVNAHYIS